MKISKFLLSGVLCLSLILPSCKTLNNAVKGAGIGTVAGAAVGAGVGKLLGNTALGAIAGAAVGGTTGGLIGHHMDKQAEELEGQLGENANVQRVDEGIKVTFDSGILFETGKAELNSYSREALIKFAQSLSEYPDTDVMIFGHTDNTGTDAINQPLSENRANAVKYFLIQNGVSSARLSTLGLGSSQPISTNTTAMGRQQNRRVEISITANEEMQKKAQNGTL